MSAQDTSPKPNRRYIWYNLAGMVVFVIVLVYVTFWGLDRYTHHGEEIAVPDVCGMSYEQAIAKIEATGLQAEVRDTGFVRGMAPGTILEQSIAAGKKVKSGRLIALTINSGNSPTVILPDLADNSSLREAESRLKAMGFKLDSTQYIRGEKDWVYEIKANGHNVAAGQRIPIDARITIVAGDGTSEDDFLEGDSTELFYWENENKESETGLQE